MSVTRMLLAGAIVAALGGLILATSGAPGSSAWREVAPGVAHRTVSLPGGASGDALRVRLETAEVRVIDARTDKTPRATARELRARVPGAIAAVNGGFFDERGRPMGLVLATGDERNTLRRADWGVFYVAEDRAGVVHTRDWRAERPEAATQALQAGPRLVVDGRPVQLKAQVARRTVVCVREPQEIVLLVLEAVDARVLAEWLAKPVRQDGLGCRQALNLDGGPSTQLSLDAGGRSLEIAGGWPVPNGLVVVPRPPPAAPASGADEDADPVPEDADPAPENAEPATEIAP